MILLLFLCTSCNIKLDKSGDESFKKESVINDTKISHIEDSIDYFKRVNEFAFKVLGDKLRIHEFTDLHNVPSHLNIFPTEGLVKIAAFSNKDYPERIEPYYYEHFTLFCIEYKSTLDAELSFKGLTKLALYDLKTLDSLDSLTAEKVKLLIVESKPGGFIFQKGNWLFSLVETCRDTPIGGTWADYESLLISFFADNYNDSVTVLDADCGNMKYIEKTIKPAYNNR
ncbi:MAG: hypothetical protein GX660_26400 [Clostridiaceae bacterium]|nr:hypothetical protein [Clostridiaceae bacterium]